jgi:hypothetical protein
MKTLIKILQHVGAGVLTFSTSLTIAIYLSGGF